jgi:hypothetical protein
LAEDGIVFLGSLPGDEKIIGLQSEKIIGLQSEKMIFV